MTRVVRPIVKSFAYRFAVQSLEVNVIDFVHQFVRLKTQTP